VCSGDAQRVTSRVEDEVARDGVYLGFPVLKATFVVYRATKTTKHPRQKHHLRITIQCIPIANVEPNHVQYLVVYY
jgi:hypothetical protein